MLLLPNFYLVTKRV